MLYMFAVSCLLTPYINEWKPMKLTLGEFSRQSGISKPYISKLIKTGRISAERLENGQYRIDPAELDRLGAIRSHGNREVNVLRKDSEAPQETVTEMVLQREVALLREMLQFLGELAMRGEPLDIGQVHTHYQQALALADALGMRPLQAHCHRSLGTLYATAGRREQARTALSTAIAMYRAMAMTFWLPEIEAVLTQVDAR
jgi:excisionase family DNA binding protein